jgi:hypothetical protein
MGRVKIMAPLSTQFAEDGPIQNNEWPGVAAMMTPKKTAARASIAAMKLFVLLLIFPSFAYPTGTEN